MRRPLFCLLLLLLPLAVLGQRPVRFLHLGDTIAILSPSSATDSATILGGIRTLESWGYRTLVAPHALSEYHGFAGTIDQRRSDLLWALHRPGVKAIMCSRGGDGAVHLLTEIPLDTFRCHPKLIVGFSDVTALLCAEARAGHAGIHGSMCHALGTYQGNDTVSQTLRHMLAGELPVYRVAPHALNQTGRARGLLVGGNMSVFSGLAGSDFDPLLLDDIILFVEDTGEGMTKIDRLLHQIEVRGLMSRVRAVIVGQFTRYTHPENGFDDMYHMLHEYLSKYSIPVCYDFPVGHSHLRNFPLLTGVPVTLDVAPDGVTLTFHPDAAGSRPEQDHCP